MHGQQLGGYDSKNLGLETVDDDAGFAVIDLLSHQELLDVSALVSLHLQLSQ